MVYIKHACLRITFSHNVHGYIAVRAVFAECPADCESCVNSETCTRCRPGLYQLSGRCHHVCPEDYEPNDKLMECTAQGQSIVKTRMALGETHANSKARQFSSIKLPKAFQLSQENNTGEIIISTAENRETEKPKSTKSSIYSQHRITLLRKKLL